jgi:hypothetical protein
MDSSIPGARWSPQGESPMKARSPATATIVTFAVSVLLAWVASPLVPSGAASGGGLGAGHDARWCRIRAPRSGDLSGLSDVTVLSGEAWAVGFRFDQSSMLVLVEHYDGSTWSLVPAPDPDPSIDRLDAVQALSATDIWAVGSQSLTTLVEHWNGEDWTVVPSANVPGEASFLRGLTVLSPRDAWAVGNSQTFDSASTKALVEHWDGRSWTLVPSPSPSETFTFLSDVTAISRRDIWAAGTYFDSGQWRTLIEHWDGRRWSVIRSPNVGSIDSTLEGIAAVSADEVWVVGYAATGGPSTRRPLVEQWDGRRWSIVPSPRVFAQLADITPSSGRRLFAAGYYELAPPGRALIEQWDGRRWTITTTGTPHHPMVGALFGIAYQDQRGDALAVGSAASPDGRLRTLAARPCPREAA